MNLWWNFSASNFCTGVLDTVMLLPRLSEYLPPNSGSLTSSLFMGDDTDILTKSMIPCEWCLCSILLLMSSPLSSRFDTPSAFNFSPCNTFFSRILFLLIWCFSISTYSSVFIAPVFASFRARLLTEYWLYASVSLLFYTD